MVIDGNAIEKATARLARKHDLEARARYVARTGAATDIEEVVRRLADSFAAEVGLETAKVQKCIAPDKLAILDRSLEVAPAACSATVRVTTDALEQLGKDTALRVAEIGVVDRQRALEEKKRGHLIGWKAQYPDPVVVVSVMLVLWTAHIVLDASLLADVTRRGLAGGAMLAAQLSAPNLILGFTLGFAGLRARNHRSPRIRALGSAIVVCCLVMIGVWNFLIAHLRLAAESAARAGLELDSGRALASAFTEPGAILQSWQALVLLICGLTAAAIAGAEGYRADDPYPRHGSWDRYVRDGRREVARAQRLGRSKLLAAAGNGGRRLSREVRGCERTGRRIEMGLGRIAIAISESVTRLEHQERAHTAALQGFASLATRLAGGRIELPAAEAIKGWDMPGVVGLDVMAVRRSAEAKVNAARAAASEGLDRIEAVRLRELGKIEAATPLGSAARAGPLGSDRSWLSAQRQSPPPASW